MKIFRVLRKESRFSLQRLNQPAIRAVHFDLSSDRIAIRMCFSQPDYDRSPRCSPVVFERPDLRPETALENQIEGAVSIEIRSGECAAVVGEVYAGDAGEIVKMP